MSDYLRCRDMNERCIHYTICLSRCKSYKKCVDLKRFLSDSYKEVGVQREFDEIRQIISIDED